MPKIVDHEARKEQIAEAVWRVAADHGVQALTVRAVASQLGASTGIVTHYFPNRAALLLYAFELVGQRAEQRMRRHRGRTDPLTALALILQEALPLDDVRRSEAAIWFAFIGLAAGNDELQRATRARYRDWHGLVTGLLTDAQRTGQIIVNDPDVVATQAIAITDGIALRAHLDPAHLPAKEQEAQLRAWLGQLAPPQEQAGS